MRGFAGSGLLAFIIALLANWKPKASGASSVPSAARLPAPAPTPLLLPASSPVPWPMVVPSDLPPFPGAGWEYDEPPPPEVQQRAGQLFQKLWASGGSHVIEQTAGRWIAYRGELLRGGNRGVVAYRLKLKALPRPAPPAATVPPVARPPVPDAPLPQPPSYERSPGMPQPPSYTESTWHPAPGGAVDTVSPLALPTLRYGSGLKPHAPDPDVALLQQKLGIASDGQFGKGTQAAVVAFQKRSGLAPDGIVGPQTWSALFLVRS